jgi:tRNA nucleotidyltransferase/poly(A) polymerase
LPPEGKEQPYSGRWVARLRGKIVGQGGTPRQALNAAKHSRLKETPDIEYMASQQYKLPQLAERVSQILAGERVYLVGGAVRDLLLDRPVRDLDFAIVGKAIPAGRKVANSLKADFFPLDTERDAGRVIVSNEDGSRIYLDFVAMQGRDIDADLFARDVSINSMAIDLDQPNALLDPSGGAQDLLSRRLRATSAQSFAADPVRVLRAVRMASAFNMAIDQETRALLRAAAAGLKTVSAERMRDELFRLLLSARLPAALRALDSIGALNVLFPELQGLKGLQQSPPHMFDVWEHTLHVLQGLEKVFGALGRTYPEEGAGDLQTSLIVLSLGRYREQLSTYLAQELVADRPRRALLALVAMFHDVGKGDTRSVGEDGRIHFYGHEKMSAQVVRKHSAALHLSNAEVEFIDTVTSEHMRPMQLTKTAQLPTRRAIYRYFRDTGDAGVAICLLSLADFLGKYGAQVPEADLRGHLETLRALLEAFYEKPQESVAPALLLNGDQIMIELGLEPGPRIGELVDALREAQATGEVNTRAEAAAFLRSTAKIE